MLIIWWGCCCAAIAGMLDEPEDGVKGGNCWFVSYGGGFSPLRKVSIGWQVNQALVQQTYLLGLNYIGSEAAAPRRSHNGSTPEMAASRCSRRLNRALLSSWHRLLTLPMKDLLHHRGCCLAG